MTTFTIHKTRVTLITLAIFVAMAAIVVLALLYPVLMLLSFVGCFAVYCVFRFFMVVWRLVDEFSPE